MQETFNRDLFMSRKEDEAEMERCKDPVYFYNNYITVNGQKPTPITKEQWDERLKEYERSRNAISIEKGFRSRPYMPDETFNQYTKPI